MIFAAVMLATLAPAAEQARSHHASREAALQLLRSARVLDNTTEILSADWSESTREWKIVLRPRVGDVTCWLVDRFAKTYVRLRKD